MRFYNFVLLIFFIPFVLVYAILSLFNKRLRDTFPARLGFSSFPFSLNNPVWFHCSSLGEVKAIESLVLQLKKRYPAIFISTLTETGLQKAKDLVQDNCSIIPFDINFLTRRFIKKLKPRLLVIEETEIWPNLIHQADAFGIPVIYINALISKKSSRFYNHFNFLFSPVLNRINTFFIQNEETSRHLRSLRVPSRKIKFIGITKFDLTFQVSKAVSVFSSPSSIITCGSTREGEEQILINVFQKLKKRFPSLKIIIIPRHIERIGRIKKLLDDKYIDYDLFSRLVKKTDKDVFIVDKIGVLMKMYHLSDISFIGGTLVPIGGHNPLEPAFLKKPIVFGPHIHNNYVAFTLLLKNRAALMVKNEKELEIKLSYLLSHPSVRKKMGQSAMATLKKNQGASKRLLDVIWKKYLKK
ncbi:MAG: 3-deoxy-D-manno-octulosonic acid transferase [Spirochaetes bacterium]|nr:3-deoxy-D-manno-octulosonic acid transferase [Spirochaetota bacterium]